MVELIVNKEKGKHIPFIFNDESTGSSMVYVIG
jgi:hypothetical protein